MSKQRVPPKLDILMGTLLFTRGCTICGITVGIPFTGGKFLEQRKPDSLVISCIDEAWYNVSRYHAGLCADRKLGEDGELN